MKMKLIIMVSFLYFFHPLYTAYACSFAKPMIVFGCDVRKEILEANDFCSDDVCTFQIKKVNDLDSQEMYSDVYKNEELVGFISQKSVSVYWKFRGEMFSAIESICSNEIGSVVPILKQKYQFEESGEFVFIGPYTTETFTQLTQDNSNLFECSYQKIERVEDWIIVTNSVREYCHIRNISTDCSIAMFFNPVYFLAYLVKNPSWQTFPYWLMVGTFFVAVIYAVKLGRKGLLLYKTKAATTLEQLEQ